MESTTTTQRSFVDNLCIAYEAQLVHYLHQMLGSRERAQNLAQEAFAALYAADAPDKLPFPRAALFRVATNFALMELRRRRLATAGITNSVYLEEVAAHRVSPAQQVHADRVGEQIAEAIKALRSDHRRVFVMAHVKGMTGKEIGDVLGISERRVHNLMTKALKTCRERLSAKGIDLADMVGVLLLLHFTCALSVH